MTTRAKFNCFSVTQFNGGAKSVKLQAVTDDGDPENKAFWSATPSGTIEVSISNPAAADVFEAGKSYYVDFTPIAAATSPALQPGAPTPSPASASLPVREPGGET